MRRMPAMYEIRYQPQGKVERFYGSRGNYYEFEDGTRLDVHTTPAWCRACGGLTHGERIDSLARIDQQIADLNDPSSELYRFTQRSLLPELDDLVPKDKFRLDQLAEAHKRRDWRHRRTSPPRCIRCGSTDVVILPIGEAVPHPAGAGTIEVRWIGMCSTSFNEWFFTPEGERIPRDTKPTYWHHPALDNTPSALRDILRRRGGGEAGDDDG